MNMERKKCCPSNSAFSFDTRLFEYISTSMSPIALVTHRVRHKCTGLQGVLDGGADVCIKIEFVPRVTLGTILSDFSLELL